MTQDPAPVTTVEHDDCYHASIGMDEYGGHFMRCLAATIRAADPDNKARIAQAFPNSFEHYRKLGAALMSTPRASA